jgi:integrase
MMSLERLRYVDRIPTAKGTYYYFRRKGERERLPGTPADPDFMVAYERLLRGAKKADASAGTFAAIISSYYGSAEYKALRDVTKAAYRSVLERIREKHGHRSFVQMRRKQVKWLLDQQSDTPGAASNTLKLVRVLVRHALDEELMTDDPTLKIRKQAAGRYRAWTEEEITQFEARWPIGTPERLAFALHLYTGQRRGDVVRMTWKWFAPDLSTIAVAEQQKTGARVTVPVHADLRAVLAASGMNHVGLVLTGLRGKKLGAVQHGDRMRAAARAAGLPSDCKLHGLRKAAGRRLAEAGCGIQEIMAVLGHVTVAEAENYARDAERVILAKSAMAKLASAKR